MVMRDFRTGYFKLKMLRSKDKVPEAMEEAINELRSDPRFKLPADCGYQLVSELRCDPAGEQRNDSEAWISMCKRMQVRRVTDGDPPPPPALAPEAKKTLFE